MQKIIFGLNSTPNAKLTWLIFSVPHTFNRAAIAYFMFHVHVSLDRRLRNEERPTTCNRRVHVA